MKFNKKQKKQYPLLQFCSTLQELRKNKKKTTIVQFAAAFSKRVPKVKYDIEIREINK